MSRSFSRKKNRKKTVSSQQSGGCFSVPFFPIMIIFLFSAFILISAGETTKPWELKSVGADQTTNNFGGIAAFFTPEVQYWEDHILRWANDWGLDPNLVAAVMQIESCGNPNALSPAGAIGLFQVMPYHFSSGEDPYKPNTNAKRGLGYLQKALDEHNSIRLAFAGYNGGIATAGKPESYWKSETVRYVYWGVGIYKNSNQDDTASPILNEWLTHGGASLCAQANQRLGLFP